MKGHEAGGFSDLYILTAADTCGRDQMGGGGSMETRVSSRPTYTHTYIETHTRCTCTLYDVYMRLGVLTPYCRGVLQQEFKIMF